MRLAIFGARSVPDGGLARKRWKSRLGGIGGQYIRTSWETAMTCKVDETGFLEVRIDGRCRLACRCRWRCKRAERGEEHASLVVNVEQSTPARFEGFPSDELDLSLGDGEIRRPVGSLFVVQRGSWRQLRT